MNEAQKRSNIALAAEAERVARQPNGDPGGQDAFDGGCPSDTITAQIIDAPLKSYAYATLHVYSPGVSPSIVERNDYADAIHQRDMRNKHDGRGNVYVVAIPVPAFKERAK